jgi:hypothetical protein
MRAGLLRIRIRYVQRCKELTVAWSLLRPAQFHCLESRSRLLKFFAGWVARQGSAGRSAIQHELAHRIRMPKQIGHGNSGASRHSEENKTLDADSFDDCFEVLDQLVEGKFDTFTV